MTIKHSEQLNDLFSALSKLQGKIENAKKNKAGYKPGHKYADLNQYIEASKELLEEHGLCVLQLPGSVEIVEATNEEGKQIKIGKQMLTTWIGHQSGQFISESMEMLAEKTKGNTFGQGSGSALSYMRRYALAGSLGMSQEDDDNRLSQKDSDKSYSQTKKSDPVSYLKINKEQADYIKSLLKEDPERFKKMLVWANVNSVEDLSVTAYTSAVNTLLAEQKNQSLAANKDDYLIGEHQIACLKKLVTPERLHKILKYYNLTKIEEMKLADYFKEYDQLRQEMTTSTNDVSDKKQA